MSSRRILSLSVCAISGLLAAPAISDAAAYKWLGGGADGNWMTPANWDTVPVDGDPVGDVTLAGFANLVTNQNIKNPLSLNSLFFDPSAGAFTINGSTIRFIGTFPVLSQGSARNQVINTPLSLSTTDLSIVGGGAGTLSLFGAVSEGGVARGVTQTTSGRVSYNGANTFSGGFTLTGGTAQFGASTAAALASGPFGTGTVTLTGGNIDTFGQPVPGTLADAYTLANPISYGGSVTFGGPVAGDRALINFSAPVTFTANANRFQVNRFSAIQIGSAAGGLTEGPGITAGFTKSGAGQMVLTFQNFATGPVVVGQGVLTVNGALGTVAQPVASLFINQSGWADQDRFSSLRGAGTVFVSKNMVTRAPNVTVAPGCTIKPGNSPGILTLDADVGMNAGSFFGTDIDGPVAGNNETSNYGQLDVNGNIDISGAILQPVLNYDPTSQDMIFVIDHESTADLTTGQFSQGSFVDVPDPNGVMYRFQISYDAIDVGNPALDQLHGGNDVVLYGAQIVPEPATMTILAGGTLGLLARRRRTWTKDSVSKT